MTTIDAASWQTMSPLLDELLETDSERRAVRLAQLQAQDPALAGELAEFLAHATAVESEHFLEGTAAEQVNTWTLAGQVIGDYTLDRPIGEGGMGTVWLARRCDGHYESRVAVKFLNLALLSHGGTERFRRESNALAKLAHPNITHLLDAGVAAGQPYIVLEYVEGEPIDRWCDARLLDVAARIRLFLEVLAAVSHAHGRLILHRDLKPSNILVTSDGRAKLLDFGMAKLLDDESATEPSADLTVIRGHAFTPEYAAPEQVQRSEATTATDIYALGVLLYILLTGTHPTGLPAAALLERLRALVEDTPARASEAAANVATPLALARASSPTQLARVLRGDLDNIVATALKKSRSERYPTVEALADDLRRYLKNEPVSVRADSVGYRVRKFACRHRAALTMASAAVVTLIVVSVVAVWQLIEANRQRAVAHQEAARAAATRDFIYSVLTNAGTEGRPFTTVELLAQAERTIDAQYGSRGDPLATEQLLQIADVYSSLAQPSKALELAQAAHRRATKAGHAGLRRQAACAIGQELYVTGKLEEAIALVDRTIAELRGRSEETLTLVGCLRHRSDMDLARGNVSSGLAIAREAVQLSTEAFRTSPLCISPRMHLAVALRVAGERALADDEYRSLAQLLERLGRERSVDAVSLFSNWSKVKADLGDMLDAVRLIESSIAVGQALRPDANPDHVISLSYAQTLLVLHRLDEAQRYFTWARQSSDTENDPDVQFLSLLGLAAVERERGNLAAARTAVEAADQVADARFPSKHRARNALLMETGRLHLASNSFDAAAAALSEVAAQNALAQAATPYHALTLALLAQAELGAGSLARATTFAGQARSLADQFALPGKPSYWIGYCLLVQSEIERAANHADRARERAVQAADQLRQTVGAGHPLTQQASMLAEAG